MSRSRWIFISLIALLAIGFALLSLQSTRTKNPVGDEPLHAVAGFTHVQLDDYRVDPEDPPLFEFWAMLNQPADALRIDTAGKGWSDLVDYPWRQYLFTIPTLYHTPGVDADAFVNRSRAMMCILGAILAGVIAWFAWEIAGAWAALLAVALFCFDPNFLAHASLIKNDVALALITCALALAVYRAGQRLTILRALSIALLIAAALTVKFSGILLFAIAAIVLLLRATMGRPWLALGNIVVRPRHKFGLALATILLSALVGYAGIWACYGFRYAPTREPTIRLNFPLILRAAARNQLKNRSNGDDPAPEQIDQALKSSPLIARAIMLADDHQIFPQAWLAGLLDTWATTLRRPAFLLDQVSATGWWYYFPLAMLFKTPLATIAMLALSFVVALRWRVVDHRGRFDRWAILCIFVPVLIYTALAMISNLNLGIRHMLPIYPLLYVWMGAALAPGRPERRSRITLVAVSILLVGLIASTVRAYPNYLAFFNITSGGSRGGLHLLGDSNLDWGQDFKLLAQWQREHPDVTIYLDPFSGIDPAHYVTFKPLFASDDAIVPAVPLHEKLPGPTRVMAISATKLQGIYPPIARWDFYQQVQQREPIAVLGGTIYLYRLPLD